MGISAVGRRMRALALHERATRSEVAILSSTTCRRLPQPPLRRRTRERRKRIWGQRRHGTSVVYDVDTAHFEQTKCRVSTGSIASSRRRELCFHRFAVVGPWFCEGGFVRSRMTVSCAWGAVSRPAGQGGDLWRDLL